MAPSDERWVNRPCHITCRACKRYYAQGSSPSKAHHFGSYWPMHLRHELRQNRAGHQQIWQEKTRTVAARRHDTLCVRGVFYLFLLEQYLAAFCDSNYGGKTTLIVSINRMGHSSRSPGKLGTPGRGLKAKAPSLWKDGNKGTQRTRKLSTGNALWSWRNGNRRFMEIHGE